MKTLLFSFVILSFSSFGFSDSGVNKNLNCETPTNLVVTAQGQNSISFDWDDCSSAFTEYQVFYTKDGQTSTVYALTKSEISFSGLAPGVYQFHFYTVCGNVSNTIIIEETIYG